MNVLSIDVEDYFHATALRNAAPPHRWDSLPSRVVGNTQRLLDLLEEFGTHGTFFVLGWVAERFPALVRSIAARGHEVACHGYSHATIYSQDRAEFRAETLKAKSILEDQAQRRIVGYRAATFSIVRSTLWAVDELIDAGFVYDSSIVPVRHDLYGLPGAPREPHEIRREDGRRLIEFPPSTVRVGGMTLPIGGGGYFRLLPLAVTRWAIRRVNAEGLPFMFYMHPWEVDTDQPRFDVGPLSKFRHYRNLDVCFERLRSLVTTVRFGTAEAYVLARHFPGSASTST